MCSSDLTLARDLGGTILDPTVAQIFADDAAGDFRVAKRNLETALRSAAAKHADVITPEIARAACRAGLKG